MKEKDEVLQILNDDLNFILGANLSPDVNKQEIIKAIELAFKIAIKDLNPNIGGMSRDTARKVFFYFMGKEEEHDISLFMQAFELGFGKGWQQRLANKNEIDFSANGVQCGNSIGADLKECLWTFKMGENFQASSGAFVIMPVNQYRGWSNEIGLLQNALLKYEQHK